MKEEKKVKSIMEELSNALSLSYLSQTYFAKHKSWFYHKLNEDCVNGVRYKFSDEEVQTLIDGLDDISTLISSTKKELLQFKQDSERGKGRYLTKYNPFNHSLFKKWYTLLPHDTVLLEPFCGCCDIPSLLSNIGIHNPWACFDVEPMKNSYCKVTKRDTLRSFPTGYKVCITNPPFLAKNSARKRGLQYPITEFDDVYKCALNLMLRNTKYVAAILPESYINSDLFRERLYGVVSLNQKLFMNTNCPTCLALFVPTITNDFYMYVGKRYLGTYRQLRTGALFDYVEDGVKWKMNSPNGNVGVICYDSVKDEGIRFLLGDNISSHDIKVSSRSKTRIDGLPSNIDLLSFVAKCNEVLAQYRQETHDIFLTPFKGLRKDGLYRRRIDFGTIKCIMNKALSLIKDDR